MSGKRIDLKAPMCWEELSKEQLVDVAGTLDLALTREEKLVTLFCVLAGVKLQRDEKGYLLHHGDDTARISIDEIAGFSERFAWIIDTEPERLPNPTQADDFIRDMTFGDWFEADTLFRILDMDGDPAHLAEILPLLKEQPRELSDAETTAYKLWWRSVQSMLADTYPNVFERRNPEEEPPPYEPFRQLRDFHLMLNDDRPQDDRLIDESNVHSVLAALDNKISKLKLQKEELDKIMNRR